MNEPPWFDHWVAAHTARFPGLDWGHSPEQLFEGWRHSFLRHRVTQAEAQAASLRAMEARSYPDAMLHLMLVFVRESRGGIVPAGPSPEVPRDCALCCGTGIAPLPPCRRHPNGSACACGCSAGAAIRAANPSIACLGERPDLKERILHDRAMREARGAERIATAGADPYGSTEEIARGVAILARRWAGFMDGSTGPERKAQAVSAATATATATGEG